MNFTDKSIEWLKARKAELSSFVDEYYKVSWELDKKQKEEDKKNINKDRLELIKQTKFIECEYPSIGYASNDGEATFENEFQAKSLLSILNKASSYTHVYEMHWEGPGKYLVIPTWAYDYDGDIIYTATFEKDNLEK